MRVTEPGELPRDTDAGACAHTRRVVVIPGVAGDRSGGATKLDHGQVLATLDIAEGKTELVVSSAASAGPFPTRFESAPRRGPALECFQGRPARERHVRTAAVVPTGVGFELPPKGGMRQRDEKAPRALVLQGADEPFDDADAGRLAENAVARSDASAFAPAPEPARGELPPAIGDDVAGRMPLAHTARSRNCWIWCDAGAA